MGLNWQTDEDEPLWSGDPKPRRRWPLLTPQHWLTLVGVLFFVLAGIVLMRQISQRTAEQEQKMAAEVEASYQLLARASANRDLELLRLVLSGRDSGWSYEQQSQLLRGQLLSRPFSGWTHLPSQDETHLTLGRNLHEAQLVITQTYHLQHDNLPAITLRQHVYFERGATRWLYAPLPTDFWGGEQRVGGRYLTTTYLERDALFAHDLHGVLEDALGRYCGELGRLCPPDVHIEVRLTADPANLSKLFDSRNAVFSLVAEQGLIIELPTPSLAGQPVDEMSQQALYGQYANYLLTAVNREWVIGSRRVAEPLDAVLRDAQWRALGLPPQLPSPHTLSPLFWDDLLDYRAVWSAIGLPNDELFISRAQQLITFLEPLTAERTPLELQRLLTQPSFVAWLEQSTGLAFWQIERAWERHVYAQTAVSPRLAPASYPNQVVSLLCTQSNQAVQYVTINHWGDAPRWSASNTLGSAARYQFTHWPLPADDGFVLQQTPLDASETNWFTLLVYDDGQGFQVFDANNGRTPLTYTGLAHPNGRPLVMMSPDPELGFAQFQLLDPAQCTAEGCPMITSRGLPVWNPTGTHTLLTSFQGLHLGDGEGQRAARLEQGTLPFWLGADWYGYLRPLRLVNEGGVLLSETAVVLGRLNGHTMGREEILTAADILAAIPPTTLPDSLRYRTTHPLIDKVVAHPHNGRLYLLLHLHGQPQKYLIGYDHVARRGQLLVSLTAEPEHLAFSANGRWLTLTAFEPVSNGHLAQVYAYDLISLRTHHYTAELGRGMATANWRPDWSADEQWLIFTDDQSAHLIAPLQNYHQRLFHDYLSCGQAAWLNE